MMMKEEEEEEEEEKDDGKTEIISSEKWKDIVDAKRWSK